MACLSRSRWPWFLLACPLVGLMLSSCATTTTTISRISESDLQKIKKVGVFAKQEADFSVRVSRQRLTNIGAVFFGLVGAGVEAGIRSSADAKLEEQLKPLLSDYDLRATLEDRLRYYIETGKADTTVEKINPEDGKLLKAGAFHATLEVRLKEWGLRLCSGSGMGEQVEVGLDAYGKLVRVESDTVIWERHELYLDGNCYRVEELQSRQGLLREALSRAVNTFAGRLVNEILYLPEAQKKSALAAIPPMTVVLEVEDQRPAMEQNRVGTKKIGFGQHIDVKSNRGVVSVVRDALKAELQNNGHSVTEAKGDGASVAVKLRLRKYWGDLIIGFWSFEFVGTVSAEVTIFDNQGKIVGGTKTINATFREGRAIVTDGAFESVLNGALGEFVRSFSRDPAIMEALRLAQQGARLSRR